MLTSLFQVLALAATVSFAAPHEPRRELNGTIVYEHHNITAGHHHHHFTGAYHHNSTGYVHHNGTSGGRKCKAKGAQNGTEPHANVSSTGEPSGKVVQAQIVSAAPTRLAVANANSSALSSASKIVVSSVSKSASAVVTSSVSKAASVSKVASTSASSSTSKAAPSTSKAASTLTSKAASSTSKAASTSTAVSSTPKAVSSTSKAVSSASRAASSAVTPSAPASSTSATASAPSGYPQTLLTLHNNFRAEYGAAPLTWDPVVAQYAMDQASKCVFAHSHGPYGENLAAGVGGGYDASSGFWAWANEAPLYDYNNPVFGPAGHFTQVVWKGTSKLGCAVVSCPVGSIFPASYNAPNVLVWCNYEAPGNYDGQFAANVGKKIA